MRWGRFHGASAPLLIRRGIRLTDRTSVRAVGSLVGEGTPEVVYRSFLKEVGHRFFAFLLFLVRGVLGE